jgi:hypothetical protein
MSKVKRLFLSALVAGLATVLMVGCGSGMGGGTMHTTSGPTGSLVAFGTDQPSCDVESFMVTISSAALVPQGGGAAVPITPPSQPVDFASLVDFTNILSLGSVAAGTYSQLTLTLTNPQLTILNTSTIPPSAQPVTTTFSNGTSTDMVTVNINPALTITTSATSGLVVDFNLRQSVQTDPTTGLVTGVVDPQFTLTPSVASGTELGEADTLYGVVQSAPTTTSSDPSFSGSFPLQVQGGVGQILTVQVTSTTDFEGDSVTGLSNLTQGTFVEVDAIVDTSGNIIAQEVDAEEQVVTTGQHAGFLGKIIGVTRDSSGNATGFNLLVGRETRDVTSEVPLQSSLTVTLADTTRYWTNWHHWNRKAFQFGPQTLGLAEKVAVFGDLQAGSAGPPATPATLTAGFVFLRQRNVLGTFVSSLAVGSDDRTGGFTLLPCGPLFGGQTITVLTFGDGRFRGMGGLKELTPGPILDVAGLLFYEQTNGPGTPPTWTAPTWVMQGKVVHHLPQ